MQPRNAYAKATSWGEIRVSLRSQGQGAQMAVGEKARTETESMLEAYPKRKGKFGIVERPQVRPATSFRAYRRFPASVSKQNTHIFLLRRLQYACRNTEPYSGMRVRARGCAEPGNKHGDNNGIQRQTSLVYRRSTNILVIQAPEENI